MIIARASESLHWYRKDGASQYTVEAKDGSQRPTTLRDAKKMGLLPSVTTIIKAAANPGLEAWKLNQMMLAALTLPRSPDEPELSFISRVQADSREQARKAADRGTQVHSAIERFFDGQIEATSLPYLEAVYKQVDKHFGTMTWAVEKSFGSELGFGGKIDLHSADGEGVVIDFKTKEFTSESLDKAKGFDEHVMQLAAYRMGLKLPKARCANLFVSTVEPGLVVVREWSEEELERGWNMFSSLKDYWYAKSGL